MAIRAALPLWVEIRLERLLSAGLGARVEIGDVDLELGSPVVLVKDAAIHARLDGAELGSVRRIVLEPDWGALVAGRLEAERAELDAAQLRLGPGAALAWADPGFAPGSVRAEAEIALEARNLRWPPLGFESLHLDVTGLAPRSLGLEGSWASGRADLQLRALEVDLVPWSPLLERYAGASVSRGILSVRSRFRLRGETYEAPTRITLRDLEVAAEAGAFREAFGVPLTAAIRQLRDSTGRIELEVGVRGRVNEGSRLELLPRLAEALEKAIRERLAASGSGPRDAGRPDAP